MFFQLLKVICLISKTVFFAQESENRSGVKCVGKLASCPVVDGNRHKYNLLEAKFGNVKTAITQAYPLCSNATEIVYMYKKEDAHVSTTYNIKKSEATEINAVKNIKVNSC